MYSQLRGHHKWLIISSHSSLISAMYCIYFIGFSNNLHWIYPIGVYINSINYWRNPVKGIRRNIDMTFGCSGLAISLIYAYWNINTIRAYYWLTFIACIMYPINCWFASKNYFVLSTIAHMLVHLFGNAGKIVLYNK